MNADKKRYDRQAKENEMVRNLVGQGQLDLDKRLDHSHMSNIARHSLDWSLGRLQKAVERVYGKIG